MRLGEVWCVDLDYSCALCAEGMTLSLVACRPKIPQDLVWVCDKILNHPSSSRVRVVVVAADVCSGRHCPVVHQLREHLYFLGIGGFVSG